jgi:signal transduction histidine kinase
LSPYANPRLRCHDSFVGGSLRAPATARAGALALGAFGAGFGLLTLTEARSAPGFSFGGTSWVAAVAELGAGLAVIAAGVADSLRRPSSRAGLLLAVAGIGWFFTDWNNAGLASPLAFSFGLAFSALAPPLVAHAALAYPTGRLGTRRDVGAVLFAYVGAGLLLGLAPALFFDPGQQGCSMCPANLLQVRSEPGLYDGLVRVGLGVGLLWVAALVAVGTVRIVTATPPLRRMLWPVLFPAGCFLVLVAADFAYSWPRGTLSNDPPDYRLWLAEATFLVLMALGVAWAWVRDRRTRSALVRLMMKAAEFAPPGGLRDVLAQMLDDASLDIAYLIGEPPRHVGANGQPASVEPGNGQDVTSLARDGRTVATLRHRAGLLDDPGLVREMVAAARLGMDNERLRAEVLAQVEDLRAARARIVATGDVERRRLERDLHDGAQQRLVALSLALRVIHPTRGAVSAQRIAGLIDQADQELRLAIDELRDLARGIYPAVLVDEGLAAAVEALAEISPIPLTIAVLPQERLPTPVEAAGYFLIAAACGLVAAAGAAELMVLAKYDAESLTIHLTSEVAISSLEFEASLSDVADRVGAVGGSLCVECSPADAATIIAQLPCAW